MLKPDSLRKYFTLLFALSLVAIGGGRISADDRDLLRDSTSDPYVFILLDTSGSMNWSSVCSQEQIDAGVCDFLCPTGDCFVSLNGDDPRSKFYEAKAALWEVLSQLTGVNFGFATYNQDTLFVRNKHWLYEASATKPDLSPNDLLTLQSLRNFPAVGAEEVFGLTWSCDQGTGFSETGCHGNSMIIADMDDPIDVQRAQRLPKLGVRRDWTGIGRMRDAFDSSSFVNNDGTLNWATNWIEEDNQGAGAGSGSVQVAGGWLQFTDNPSSNPKPSLWRGADLTGFPSAELYFDWQTSSGVDVDDSIVVEISSDGGASYRELENFTGYSGAVRGSHTEDISADISANVRIRFRINNEYDGNNEFFFVDNVHVGPEATIVYLEDSDGERYKFGYWAAGDAPNGAPTILGSDKLPVDLEARRCIDDANSCVSELFDQEIVYFDLVSDFLSWDGLPQRDPARNGFFTEAVSADTSAFFTCNGWDSNDDTADDDFITYNLRWPTDPDPPPLRFDVDQDGTPDLPDFAFGDVIPLDWEDTHKADIMKRLAPNTQWDANGQLLPASPDPDFSIASYLNDEPLSGEFSLRLKDENNRVLLADGDTPLIDSIANFSMWLDTWKNTASQFDDDIDCRKIYLVVLTDGDEECGRDCLTDMTDRQVITDLRDKGVDTFLVAFGVTPPDDPDDPAQQTQLTCIAEYGTTPPPPGEEELENPVYPQNKQELVDMLLRLFGDVKAEARSFASASVPTVQNETSDQIYLARFTPLPGASVWAGQVDAFRRPLPLKEEVDPDTMEVTLVPDFGRSCGGADNRQSACHLWDAGARLLSQAPTQADVDGGNFKIGTAVDERRVFYGKENLPGDVPTSMRVFDTPSNLTDEFDLWRGFGLSFTTGGSAADLASQADARDRAAQIMGDTLKIKQVQVPDPDGGPPLDFTYVLGDTFHSDPRVIGSPNNLIYFRANTNDYRAFSAKHFWRRKMLAVAANDGMIHFFDAGTRTEVFDPDLAQNVERFTDGTGRELFAYMPRMVMPIVRELAGGEKHIYSMDGSTSVADVYIDPVNGGLDPPDPLQREWRTVLIAGLREGGDIHRISVPVGGFVSGVYALDLTQPDMLAPPPPPTPSDPYPRSIPDPPAALPTCLEFDAGTGDQASAAGCDVAAGAGYPFPAELWNFTDQAPSSCGGPYYLDEEDTDDDGAPEGNDEPDLGATWSKPILGRIRVCTGMSCVVPSGADIEDRYVAVFGGGLDPGNPNSPSQGAWIYMVDIETGRAIYKRQLEPFLVGGSVTQPGAAAAAPAVIDRDRDGYFDLIYVATTQGAVFKVDLTADGATGGVPALTTVTIGDTRLLGDPLGNNNPCGTVERVTDPAWDPLPIFWTEGRPIYMTPTAFLVPDLDQFALAFGTGNRQNLWQFDGVEGRFYTIVDEDYTAANLPEPKRETSYQAVDDDEDPNTQNFLLGRSAGERGWYLRLNTDDKVITQAFALVGVLVFTSFAPEEVTDANGDGILDSCARTGESRAFVVDAENANPFVDFDQVAGLDRYEEVGDFTTSPYVDQTSTKNPESDGITTESGLDATQEALQEAIRQSLMRFFPEGCRFNKSYSLTINASRSDTGHVRYATIPIAMCPVDWKEE